MRRDLHPTRPGDEAAIKLKLLTEYQTPAVIFRVGVARQTEWPARLVHALAEGVMTLSEQIAESVPGIGTVLGAEFLAGVDGSLDGFSSPDALVAFAGVGPAPRDSGKVGGDLRGRPSTHRRLQRVFYTSPLVSIRCDPNSRRSTTARAPRGRSTSRP